jgi:hypothetical protein
MIKDVLDGLKLVSEGIQNVKTIAKAVKDGTNYLKAKHPDVRDELRALLEELRKNMNVIKQASAVLTNFRFAVAKPSELERFNDYFIKSKTEAQQLHNQIDDLRTHCSKIRMHAEKITHSAASPAFAVFSLLGLNSPQREAELGKKLYEIAYGDLSIAYSAERMLGYLEEALKDIQNALGTGGAMDAKKIPDAARLLGQYGPAFEKLENEAAAASREITESAQNLI